LYQKILLRFRIAIQIHEHDYEQKQDHDGTLINGRRFAFGVG